MLFTSLVFPLFLALCWGIYIRVGHRAQNVLLAIASSVFYGWWDWRFLFLLWGSIVINFWIGLRIDLAKSDQAKKRWLWLSLVTCLGILVFFKYADFFVEGASDILSSLGLQTSETMLAIVLPVGISFYTFQTLSYVVDVYRGKLRPARSLIDFSVYVSFFPQLVAGPIERATHFLPQVMAHRVFQWKNLQIGFWLILLGYFKKVVVADNLGVFVDQIYNQPSGHDGFVVILATYAFAFQVYCDFSGYSDIARGIARCFGFDLMLNFRQPYLARNPQQFWERWHISLSTWLRDYLYIPLGGNRKGDLRTYLNLMITMFLGGLWHGASINFVWWGCFQGVILVIHRRFSAQWRQLWRKDSGEGGVLSLFFFFNVICVGWFLFRIDGKDSAEQLLESFGNWNAASLAYLIPLGLFMVPIILLDLWFEKGQGVGVIFTCPRVVRMGLAAVLVLSLIVCGNWKADEFIYFQF